MSRPLREQTIGVYHVTSRGVDRRDIYRGDETRELHLRLLDKWVRKAGVLCHAYCLMGNHYHLLLETLEDDALAPFLQKVNSAYARNFNEIVGRRGYLFERPYRSKRVIDDVYALELCRYIPLNPVAVGKCMSAHEYRWSSYLATAGLVAPPRFLSTRWVLTQFGGLDGEAQRDFARFVADSTPRARAHAASLLDRSGVRTPAVSVSDLAA